MKRLHFLIRASVFLWVSIFLLGVSKDTVMAGSFEKPVVFAKKTKKKIKVETIQSKKALIQSVEKHLKNFDSKISYKINKRVVKNINAFEKLFGSTKNKKFIPAAILSQIKFIDYEYNDQGAYFSIQLDLTYFYSKKKMKKFVSDMKALEKAPTLKTDEEVRENFLKKYHSLEPSFRLKVSKSFSKKYQNNPNAFLDSLEDEPRFNDLQWDLLLSGDVRDYSSFNVFHFSTNSKKSKEELKRIISRMTPVLKSKEEVFSEMLLKAEKLEEHFSLNIKNDALPYKIGEGNQFWDDLYSIPEYNDLSHHNADGSYEIEKFKGYYKFTTNDKFSIKKEELDTLKNFVKTWVAENIKPEMTEEEKVRAINDYMVKEYRYTYGDRGQLSEKEAGEEKLGNYSVYTCFALINGKGGVCNAKANMFYRLAKEAGFEVLYISGKGDGEAHAWNMVKVDGNWYHLDNTWNRGHYEGTSEYEYFNNRDYYLKGDATMRKDHSWDATKYPVAPMDYQGYVPTASIGTPILNKAA